MIRSTQMLHHVAIDVADIDGAIDWYRDYLGFQFERRFELPDAGISIAYMKSEALRIELLRRGESRVDAGFVEGGDSSAPSTQAPPGGASAVSSSLRAAQSRADFRPSMHICFEVDDIEAAAGELRRRGVEFAQEPKLIPPAGVKNLWIRAFEGHLIEFLEPVG